MGALISLVVLGYIIYKVIRFFDNYKKYKEIAENISNNVEVPKEEIPQYDYSSKVNKTYKVKQSEPEKKADKIITIPQEDYENHGFQYNDEKSFDDNVDDYYMEYGGVDDYDGSAPWGSASSSHSNYCYEDYSITGPDFKFHNRLDNYTKEELLNLFEYAFVDKDYITKCATQVLFDYYLKNFKGRNINFYELLENANNHDFTTSITDVPKQLLKSVIICLEIKINSLMKKQNFYRLQTSIP